MIFRAVSLRSLGMGSLGMVLVGALVLAGCASGPRFKDQPIVWRADDARSIPEPDERPFLAMAYFPRVLVTRQLTRAMEVPDRELAHNTNALDEVPNSTWFTNRIGARTPTPAEAARGAAVQGPPKQPLSVVAGKSGGGNPGFFAKDATGRKFLIKFDTKENPEMQTGGNIVVNRIFWTLGYNVPADYVFRLRPSELRIEPGATTKDELLRKQPLTRKLLDEILATAPRLANGFIRATASEFLDGIPKGGFAAEGTRGDDPNDRVAHEHRRELRGLRVFAAWVNHTDMKEDNTLDMYVTEGKRKFLRHHFLDFGEALGGHGAEKGRPEDGWEHLWDWEKQGKATFAFGLWKRPWEDTKSTPWLSLGWFSAEGFDPREWREAYPFWPFWEMDESDAYWAAKLVMRFDRPMLKAIVEQAQFSEGGAAAYLVDTLMKRRRKIGEVYLEALSPLDYFTIEQGKLCGVDLGLHYRLATHGVVERLAGDEIVDSVTCPLRGRFCMPLPETDRYRIFRLQVRRGDEVRPVMQVHLKGGPRPRVLGIVRVEP